MSDCRPHSVSEVEVSLFIASTPLQLICCSEARRYFSAKNSMLVIARPGNSGTEQQMRNLLPLLGWQDSEVMYLGRRYSYLSIALLLRRFRRFRICDLYIGYKGSWLHEVFVRALMPERVIYLDDGVGTVKDYYKIIEGKSETAIKKKQFWLLALLGVRLRNKQRHHAYFTIFPLPECSMVSITHNDLGLLREVFSVVGDVSASNSVVFIGQPFTNSPDYLQIVRSQLASLISAYNNHSVIYYMHRKESRSLLDQAFSGMNVDVVLPDMPLEIEIARSSERPVALYSLVSTALFTIKVMMPELSTFYIPDESLAAKSPYYKEIIMMMESVGVRRAEFLSCDVCDR